MTQCRGCVRGVLFVFNFFMWLLGCAVLSVGLWIKEDDSAHHYVQRLTDKVDPEFQISYSSVGGDDLTSTLAYLLIAFGIVIILITFIGCCGAVRENTCLLITYAIFLFAVACTVIGIGAWAHYQKNNIDARTLELRETTDANIERAVDNYYNVSSKSKAFMDNVQQRFQCCGIGHGIGDYIRSRPPPICQEEPKTWKFDCRNSYFVFVANEIEAFLRERYSIIAAVCFGVACCLALGIFFTLCFCCMVKQTVITVN